jgi:hypothetical protein
MMKRLCPGVLAILAAACSPAPDQARAGAAGSQADAWLQPPVVEQVTRTSTGLSVRGQAGPGARVVLRGTAGQAFAASADASGRFDVRLNPGSTDLILTPEVQNGQETATSPDRLALLASGAAAVLTVGDATRRLDSGPGGLDAADGDGRIMILSGRAARDQTVVLEIDGARREIAADSEGRWTVAAPAGGSAVAVGGRAYRVPPLTAGDAAVARAGDGWLIRWSPSGGAGQAAWLPDRP